MIYTIEELIIVINNYEIKIKQCEIKQARFHQNYDELKRLEEKINVHKKQIERHIQEFKEKIKKNYLGKLLYANRLAVLEKKFQLQPRIKNVNLFCLNVLKEKHVVVKKDKIFFSGMNKEQEVDICENELEMIEMQSQDLLKDFFEITKKFPNSINKEMEQQFNALLDYYGWGFAEKKIVLDKRQFELEARLEVLEKKLMSLQAFFNYYLTKNIKAEIEKIKEELLEINLQDSKNIDYIL